MNEEPRSTGWWRTVPGMLTATAGFVTAITGLIVVLNQAGFFERDNQKIPKTTESMQITSKHGKECWEFVDPHGNVLSLCLAENGRAEAKEIFPNQRANWPPTTCKSIGTSRSDGSTIQISFQLGECDNGRSYDAGEMSCVRHAHSLVCWNATYKTTETYEEKD